MGTRIGTATQPGTCFTHGRTDCQLQTCTLRTVSDMRTHVHGHHRGASTCMRIHDRDTHIQPQSQAVTFTLVPALPFRIPAKIVPEGP